MRSRAHPTRSDYWLQIPLRGNFQTTVGHDIVACSSSHAAISSPSRGIALRSDAGSARLNLSISRDEVVRQLVALLGRPLHAPLEFAPEVNLGRGYGRSLARYLRLAVTEFERGDSMLFNPLMQTQFEQFIIVGLLVSHPHNCTEALRRSSRTPASRDMKRAIDYMQGNLQAPITIAVRLMTSLPPISTSPAVSKPTNSAAAATMRPKRTFDRSVIACSASA